MTERRARVGRDITVEERRSAVLSAAVRCIAEQGWQNVRLRDVASTAGVSIGLLQHYFESREQLVAQAFGQASRDLLEQATAADPVDASAWSRVVALLEPLFDPDYRRTRSLLWVEFATAAARHAEIREAFGAIYEAWHARLREVVAAGVASGELSPVMAVDDVVEAILQHNDGFIMAVASGLGRVSADRMRTLTFGTAAALLGHR